MQSKNFDDMCDTAARYAEKTVSATGFITPEEISDYVNQGIGEVWDVMTRAMGLEYFSKQATISVVSGTSRYDLANDFGDLITAYTQKGGQAYEIDKWSLEDEPWLTDFPRSTISPRYRLVGSADPAATATVVEFMPEPREAFDFVYRYIPGPPVLSYGQSDVFVGHPAAVEYAEYVGATKVFLKEQADPSVLMMEAQRARARLQTMASAKDQHRPMKIKDTRRDGNHPYFWRF